MNCSTTTTSSPAIDPVLGLEVHVELSTATKMFCGCANKFGAEPNTQVCPVCLGLPGSLPVLNQEAVESAIRIGLALNCDIVPWWRFARKNYFYPDQPKNYQISQYDEPIAINGLPRRPARRRHYLAVEIERAHMEEDTGKLTHIGSDTGRIEGATTSLLDYNRAGVPADRNRHQAHRGCRGRARRRSPAPTSRRCETCCARWVSPTCGWTRARCAATPTSR